MSYEDERIISIKFDNNNFKKDIDSTIQSLRELESALNINPSNSERTFREFSRSCAEVESSLSSIDAAALKVQASFSALQIIGMTVLSELTRSAMRFGSQLYSSMIGQITSGGLIRASNIENAKFQLEGLGVEWDKIQTDLEYGVKDTAYGLDSAARAASQLYASGIKIGGQMQTALRGISGVAAMTNRSYDDIAHIFTRVAGQGRVMGQDLQSLAASGLNAAQVLGKALGKTEAEIRSMVSKGQIDFATFSKAMDDAFGEHAKEANKTFTGALSNMKAALSRIGADFIMPYRDSQIKVFNALKESFNSLRTGLKPLADLYAAITDKTSKLTESLLTNEKFLESIKHFAYDAYTLFRSINIAFQEFFGFGPNIDNITSSLLNASLSMELFGDKALAVENLVKSLLSLGRVVFIAFDSIADIVLELLDMLGIYSSNLRNVSANAKTFSNRVNKIADAIRAVADVLRKVVLISALIVKTGLPYVLNAARLAFIALAVTVGGVSKALMFAGSKIVEFVDKIRTGQLTIADIIDWTKSKLFDLRDGFVEFIHDVLDGFESIGTKLKNAVDFMGMKTSASDAKKEVDSLTKSAEKYSDTMSSANIGGSGGKMLGKFGVHAIDINKAHNALMVGDSPSSIAKEELKEISTTNAEVAKDIDNNNPINTVLETTEKKTKSFGEKLKNIFSNIVDVFKNPKMWVGIIAGLAAIPLIIKMLKNIAFSDDMGAQSSVLKQLSMLLLSVGALIATIGIVSKFCDMNAIEKFTKFLLTAMGLVYLVGMFVYSLASLNTLIKSASRLMNSITGYFTKTNTTTKFLTGLTNLFKWIAIMQATMLAGIVVIAVMEKKCGYASIIKAALTLSGLMLAYGAMMALITMNMRTSDTIITKFNLKSMDFSRSMSSSLNSLVMITAQMIPLIAVLSASVYYLSKQDPIKVVSSAAILFAGITGALILVMVVMKKITSSATMLSVLSSTSSGSLKISSTTISKNIRLMVASIAKIISSIVALALGLAISLKIIGSIDNDKLEASVKALGSLLAVTLSITTLLMIFTKNVMASAKLSSSYQITKQIHNITKLLSMITVAALGMAISLKIISSVPKESLRSGVIALSAMMGVLTTSIIVIGATFRALTAKLNSIGTVNSDIFGSQTFQLIGLITSMTSFILLVSASLRLLSGASVDANKMAKACTLLSILINVITGNVVVLVLATKQMSSFLSGITGASSANITAKAMELVSLILAMGVLVNMLALAVSSISVFNPDKVNTAVRAIASLVLAIVGSMAILLVAVSSTGKLNITSGLTTISYMKAIVPVIVSLSALLLAISTALNTVTSISSASTLQNATNKLLSVFAVVGTFIAGFMVLSKSFSGFSGSAYGGVGPLLAIVPEILAMVALISGISNALKDISSIGDVGLMQAACAVLITALTIVGTTTLALLGLAKIISINPSLIAALIPTLIVFNSVISMFSKIANTLSKCDLSAITFKQLGIITVAIAGLIGIASLLILASNYIKPSLNSMVVLVEMSAYILVLVAALKMLSSVDGKALQTALTGFATGVADGCKVLAAVLPELLACTSALGLIILTINKLGLSLSKSTLIFSIALTGMLTVLVALGFILFSAGDVINKGLNNLIRAANDLKESLKDVNLGDLALFLLKLVGIGLEVLVAGTLLSIGGTTLALGAGALLGSLYILKYCFENAIIDSEVKSLNKSLAALMLTGVISVVAGGLLVVGGPTLALGAASMLLGFLAINKIFKELPKFSLYGKLLEVLGLLSIVGVAAVIAGSGLLIGGIPLLLGSVMIAKALKALVKAASIDISTLTAFALNLTMSMSALGLLGLQMMISLPSFVIGCSLLAAALLPLSAVGLLLAGSIALFGVGIDLLVDAMAKVALIDGEMIQTVGEKIGLFFVSLANSFVELGPALDQFPFGTLTLAGLLLPVAAGGLLIGSGLLLGASYILELAINKLSSSVIDTDWEMLGVGLLAIATFSIGLSAASITLVVAGALFTVGSLLLLAGAASLSKSMSLMESTFASTLPNVSAGLSSLKAFGLEMMSITGIYIIAAGLFTIGSGLLVAGGALFLMASALVALGGVLISKSIDMIAASINKFAESINKFAESIGKITQYADKAKESGGNIISGFVKGIEEFAKDPIGKTKEVADGMIEAFRDTWGIHSPSTVAWGFIKNIFEGFINSFSDNGGSVISTIKDFAEDMGFSFEDGLMPFSSSSATNFMDEFMNILNSDSYMSESELVGQRLGNAVANGLYKSMGDAYRGMAKLLESQQAGKVRKINDQYLAQKQQEFEILYNGDKVLIAEAMKAWQKVAYGEEEYKAQQQYYLDLAQQYDEQDKPYTPYTSGAGDTTDKTDAASTDKALSELGKATGGSTSSLADKAGSNVGGAVTNNTYNFVQNNYSPEPIDRTELYRQTNNQLNTWYKWLRES